MRSCRYSTVLLCGQEAMASPRKDGVRRSDPNLVSNGASIQCVSFDSRLSKSAGRLFLHTLRPGIKGFPDSYAGFVCAVWQWSVQPCSRLLSLFLRCYDHGLWDPDTLATAPTGGRDCQQRSIPSQQARQACVAAEVDSQKRAGGDEC